MLTRFLIICAAVMTVSTSSLAQSNLSNLRTDDDALHALQSARADMIANIKQLRAIQTYQEALKQSDGSLMETRLTPVGLCGSDMAHLCALFPVTFGTWGTN